jgi:hypothetical protein
MKSLKEIIILERRASQPGAFVRADRADLILAKRSIIIRASALDRRARQFGEVRKAGAGKLKWGMQPAYGIGSSRGGRPHTFLPGRLFKFAGEVDF